MNMKKKNIRYYILILTTLILVLSTGITYAETNSDNDQEYGKAYQEWLKLPETEKEKTLTPRMYDIPFSSLELKAADEQLESKYNLADHIDITVEDQENYGLCWAFATTKAIETNLALTKGEYYDFSEMALGYDINNYRKQYSSDTEDSTETGGNFWEVANMIEQEPEQGTILESEVPYINNYANKEKYNNAHIIKKVKEYVEFPAIYNKDENQQEVELFRKEIKNHIKKYGSIYASIKIASTEYDFDNSNIVNYYNSNTNALYYNGNNFPDHAISIVGWDDNYSKDNFAEGNKPKKDGAYIVLNSWGEEWGNKGYFYISYEDKWVETNMNGFIELEDSNISMVKEIKERNTNKNSKYDKVLVNDLKRELGEKEDNTIYIINFANYLPAYPYFNEMDIWTSEGANVEIYELAYSDNESTIGEVNLKGSEGGVLALGKLLAKKTNCKEGINNIKFNQKQDSRENFGANLVVKYEGEYIPIQKQAIGNYSIIDSYFSGIQSDGEFIIGADIVKNDYRYKYPLIIYATNGEEDYSNGLKLGNMTPKNVIDNKQTTFSIPVTITNIDNIGIKIYKNNEEVTELFTIAKSLQEISITNNTNESGEYLIEFASEGGKPAYKTITISSPFRLSKMLSIYVESTQEMEYFFGINDLKEGTTIENVYIQSNGKDVTGLFKNLRTSDSLIQFERKLSNKVPAGTYEVVMDVENYKVRKVFYIKDDQLIKISTDYRIDDYGNLEETPVTFRYPDYDYTTYIKNITTGEEKFLLVTSQEESYLQLENGNLYEIRIYGRILPKLINLNYHSYARIYVYKDKDGKKYFRTSENGENLESTTMKIYNADGKEMTNKYEQSKIELIYDAIQITTETPPILQAGDLSYNTYEIRIDDGRTRAKFENEMKTYKKVTIVNKDGNQVREDELLGTGMKIKCENEEWTVICHGDIDGNGELTVTDISKQRLNIIR